MVIVNYENITKAIHFYENDYGFNLINVPWIVRPEIMSITCPDATRWYGDGYGGYLVGSAEQSFIQMLIDGEIDEGILYMGITPCFRKEPVLDETHQNYFMKLELFKAHSASSRNVDLDFATMAHHTFAKLTGDYEITQHKYVDEGHDLEINGIEVGSYYTRSHQDYNWTCGTGLAEPRFSFANNLK